MKMFDLLKRAALFILSCILLFTASRGQVLGAETNKVVATGTVENVDQDNYIAMLNYVSLVNDEINVSSNNKLLLDEVYSSLMNNTAPHAIDDRTQIQLNDMLHTIDEYRMIDVKRERLEYIYQQNQAQALRNAVPNPLGLLSSVSSFRLSSLIASVVYMAVDSKASYDTAMAQADMQYLKDGWELDDAETAALNQSQEQLFNYMIDMVHRSEMPDKYALPNDTIKEYVQYKNNSNISRKITYFENNEGTYEKFGDYWLICADCYYQNEDYDKCLEAIDNYNDLGIEIFRKDHNLAKELPVAISAAQESIKNGKEQVKRIDGYLTLLKRNLETEDWSLRYFAAQTDLYLYSKTKDEAYLNDAYSLAKNNVNYLIDEQISLNKTYLAEVKKKETPQNATKEQKKEIKQYNKMLENDRKTELPPVYEPLYLNCDLLFALADQINISDSEKTRIEKILHGSSQNDTLFLTFPLDYSYYFSGDHTIDDSVVKYNKGEINVPASLVSDHTKIKVIIKSGNKNTEITDWAVNGVKRKKGAAVTDMTVKYTNKDSDKYDYKDGDKIRIVLTPVDGSDCPDITINFNTKVKTHLKVISSTEFERAR